MTSSIPRAGVLLVLALVLAAGAVWILPEVEQVVSALWNLPDAMTLADAERRARGGR